MAKKTYWLGKGQVLIEGTKYRTGQAIPISKVDKKTVEKWEEEGVIGEASFNTEDSGRGVTQLANTKAQLDSVSKDLVAANKRVKELETGTPGGDSKAKAQIEGLEADLEKANAQIKDSEGALAAANTQIKELEADLEKATAPKDK